MDNTFIQRKPTAMVVGSMVIPKYSDRKTIYTPKDIQFDTLYEHGVNLTYMQAWRAKEKALQFLRCHPADSYSKLPSYLYILEKTYPGSVVKLKKTYDDCFLYVFVAICTSINGWQYCRPVVVVDGTFLKLAYRGIMLTASTMYAAGTILPLAYAVVDSENDASWKWLFEQFKLVYGERANMCVVSDRNESILKATSIVYPGMPHFSCMWHIWTNIRANFKKGHLKLSELYFATTRSYTLDEFNEKMSKIEDIDPRVKAYLYDIGYHRWSRVYAMVNRTWTMTSNIAESLNVVRASTDYIHTVIDGVRRYIVYLENKKSSCGQFQLDELPCPHVLAALRQNDEFVEEYCSLYYTRANLLRTYEIPVNPLSDERKWNVPQYITEEVVNPPKGGKRQPGRP
ncbi:protein FAR1-RELATED SEQUENCE 3-like [Nicotiana sylvestris]|uniref:protein FAR1-RELATED SEQUENCE 3-like n=1 Tax=Nicotiana sylvestris TaxID=4096 RepID=UPI00388C7672